MTNQEATQKAITMGVTAFFISDRFVQYHIEKTDKNGYWIVLGAGKSWEEAFQGVDSFLRSRHKDFTE